MKSVYDALDPIVNGSITEKEKGTKYEAACVFFLKSDPFWSKFLSRVGTLEQARSWDDCPVRDTKDVGIDLMAQVAGSGEWMAIQCKCYDSDKALPKGVCDSFFAYALMHPGVDELMVMTSAAGPGANLAKQLEGGSCMFVDTAKMAASNIDWTPFIDGGDVAERVTYDPRPHQEEAIAAIESAFADHDRCKAVMACGTGKTLMSLRLAEDWMQGGPGTLLFCAPSISLVGQSMREWMAQARVPMSPLVVCSDSRASRRDDALPMTLVDFEYPATTDPESLFRSYEVSRRANPDGLVVIFSTYQSIDVIHAAQEMGVPEFDLVVCDEAHRTTGNALPGVDVSEASFFIKVHYNKNVKARKRLYMTATPRIYGETAKRKGAEEDYTIASMDDESIYGPTAYQIKFGEAVEKKLLTDYKVVVLTVQEDALGERLFHADDEGVNARALDPSDIGKIIGCWKGLIDHGESVPDDATGLGGMLVVDDVDRIAADAKPLHRAVGFCSTINDSKTITEAFAQTIEKYAEEGHDDLPLKCALRHVDGNMPADARSRNISWLGGEVAEDECRILTNARCLAEGIDVPNLDAVIFFNAKNSTVDVVQAVGRVMRRAEGKDYGYIILPIFVPTGMTPEEALDDSKVFANVWSILQALRSHDERIEAKVNALALQQEAEKNKGRGAADHRGWDEGNPSKAEQEAQKAAEIAQGVQMQLSLFPVERWEKAVQTTLVKKCGTRIYWDEWAEDVAKIAQRHIDRIGALVRDDAGIASEFAVFLKGLRDSLNPGITEDEAVQMIAQHIITVPVFDALFGDFEFAKSNPVSIAIDAFLATLSEHRIEEASDAEVLDDVYASVRRRAAAIQSDAARQQLIRDLYEKFFKVAFKATSEKMGVVYTPTEIIDYILRETDRVLKREFGKSLADDGVHILDPFAGTGSFMAHLIESDLIPDDRLEHKYRHEIHSNEILLLAYYIMTVNIEYAYHSRMGGGYVPFEGAVLTDTFQMTEEGDTLDSAVFSANSERVRRQNELPIRVIVGNPPYSAGQNNANDNNANESYPSLDARIKSEYADRSRNGSRKMSLYDSYIRAFRWASDRIGEQGVVCFVSNAGWLRGSATDGMRICLAEEFDDVYVFDLRGNQRTKGEESRREGGKVFGSGSRTPVAVTMLVKHAGDAHAGRIHYFGVEDYLSRENKLAIAQELAQEREVEWTDIVPDKHGDWFDQRDPAWNGFPPLGVSKHSGPLGIFEIWSCGPDTHRDSWVCNSSSEALSKNMETAVEFFNSQSLLYSKRDTNVSVNDVVEYDQKKIKWDKALFNAVERGARYSFDPTLICEYAYRPFFKQRFYRDRNWSWSFYRVNELFPLGKSNYAICLTGGASPSCIMTDILFDHHYVGDSQCFPLYWYEEKEVGTTLFDGNDYVGSGGQTSLFGNGATNTEKVYERHDAITDEALAVFREAYPHAFDGPNRRTIEQAKADGLPSAAANSEQRFEVAKVDIFYYVYGILHSPEYRERFASNLKKELPRIPLAEDFVAFCRAGRELAHLHLDYEEIEPWASIEEDGDSVDPGRTVKMKFGKCKKSEENPKGQDMTVLHVSEGMTLRNIPLEAYDYVVNGRSAIGWLMDRYQVKKDKASGIVNDPNDYSDDPRYIVNLVERVVAASVRTMEIVRQLPALNEKGQTANWPAAWRAS